MDWGPSKTPIIETFSADRKNKNLAKLTYGDRDLPSVGHAVLAVSKAQENKKSLSWNFVVNFILKCVFFSWWPASLNFLSQGGQFGKALAA